MRKIKITFITFIILLMSALPVAAMPDSQINSALDNVKTEVNKTISQEKQELVLQKYPVGTVYKTFDQNMTVESMEETFGGQWREIKSTFLWITDGADNDDEDGDPLHMIGARGGKRNFDLVAGIGVDENGSLKFWTDGESSFVQDHASVSIQDGETPLPEEGDTGYIQVIDNDSETLEMLSIMPPYTTVKMFERIADDEQPDEEPEPDSGDEG